MADTKPDPTHPAWMDRSTYIRRKRAVPFKARPTRATRLVATVDEWEAFADACAQCGLFTGFRVPMSSVIRALMRLHIDAVHETVHGVHPTFPGFPETGCEPLPTEVEYREAMEGYLAERIRAGILRRGMRPLHVVLDAVHAAPRVSQRAPTPLREIYQTPEEIAESDRQLALADAYYEAQDRAEERRAKREAAKARRAAAAAADGTPGELFPDPPKGKRKR